MCQPGRPGPRAESHDGSPGLAAFQRAKSTGSRLLLVDLDPGAGLRRSSRRGGTARRSRGSSRPRSTRAAGGVGPPAPPAAPPGRASGGCRRWRGARMGPFDTEPVELPQWIGLVVGGHLGLGARPARRLVDDLVVDVGDVADVRDVEAPPLQVPPDGVERQRAAGVAHVGHVVDGGPADVERDLARLAGLEQPTLSARERVVNLHREQATGPPGFPSYGLVSASSSLASASSSVTPMAKVSSETRIWRALVSIRFSPADRPLSLSRIDRFRTTSAT